MDTAASSWTKCISSQADILRTVIQLQRSKSLPIDVVCHHKRRNKPHSCGRSILQNLGKHVDRWRTFRYQPDAEQLAATALSQIFYSPLCFSSLESLEYECVESEDYDFYLGPFFNNSTLPALHSPRITRCLGTMDSLRPPHSSPQFFRDRSYITSTFAILQGTVRRFCGYWKRALPSPTSH